MLEVLYHHAKFGGARISPAAGVAKNVEFFLPAALRAAQTCRYLVYSEADFEVFRPAGATSCTDVVKFGILHAKFHPIGATTRV